MGHDSLKNSKNWSSAHIIGAVIITLLWRGWAREQNQYKRASALRIEYNANWALLFYPTKGSK